ncbi:hypothetical protein DRN52_08330 [Thermococci archaeon]|nr:MAG: hypothetical protein DRN52_08330 [Thermococci archaeon]
MLRIERRVISEPSRPIYATPVRGRVVGATVEVPSDAFLQWSVVIKNTGYRDIDLGKEDTFFEAVFGEALSDESGDPQTDMETWESEAGMVAVAFAGSEGEILKVGETKTVTNGEYVVDLELEEGKTYDAGIVVGYGLGSISPEGIATDSMKIDDAIKIVAPVKLSIEGTPEISWSY